MGIDTVNHQLVGVLADEIVVMLPWKRMTKPEALAHAAWLVILADDADEFDDILAAIQNT
jgi:hypothetical protein